MRLIIFFLLICGGLQAQVFQTNNAPYKFRGLKGDTLLIIPVGCDTPITSNPKWGTATDGALFLKTCDTTLWVKIGAKYVQVNSGGQNFANADLTATGNRSHDFSEYDLYIFHNGTNDVIC